MENTYAQALADLNWIGFYNFIGTELRKEYVTVHIYVNIQVHKHNTDTNVENIKNSLPNIM